MIVCNAFREAWRSLTARSNSCALSVSATSISDMAACGLHSVSQSSILLSVGTFFVSKYKALMPTLAYYPPYPSSRIPFPHKLFDHPATFMASTLGPPSCHTRATCAKTARSDERSDLCSYDT
ncbi:hypothetical protein IAS59_002125 [Cryptococcus gattii]